MIAVVTFSDHDEKVACEVMFQGGFNIGSHAHQQVNLMMKIMEQINVKLTATGELRQLREDELPKEIAEAFARVEAQRVTEREIDDSPYVDLPGSKIHVPELYVAKH